MTDVLTWITIALATLVMARPLIKLTIGRARPEMTEQGARGKAWSDFRWGLLIFTTPLVILSNESKNGAAQWASRLATIAVMGLILVLWLRSRARGRSAGGATETRNRPDTSG